MNKLYAKDKDKRFKYYSTTVTPPVKLQIDGPAVVTIEQVNSFGQVCLNFVVEKTTTIEKFKIDENGDINGNK